MPEAQLFRLVEFAERIWEPSLSFARTKRTNESSLKLFEAVCWLQLGLEIDCYPVSEGLRLIDQERPFLSQLLSSEEKVLQESVPHLLFYSAARMIAAGHFEPTASFRNSNDLVPYFEAGFALASKMNSSEQISIFRRFLTSSGKVLLSDAISNGLVVDFFCSETLTDGESAEGLAAGFLKTIEVMLSWNQLFSSLQSDLIMESGDRTKLRRRLGQITYWRLDLNKQLIKDHFELDAITFSGFATDFMIEAQVKAIPKAQALIESVKRLLLDWHNNHPFELSFSSSA